MSLNLAALKASFAKNKTPFAVAGVAVVGLLAWRARTAKSGATTAAPLAAGTTGYPASTSPGSTSSGYSSTSSDVYSAIQPQLEAIGQTQAQLKDLLGQTQTPPIPVPAAPAAPSTNQDWINSAISGWAGLGRNPIDIQAALSQYVQGQPVNQYQTPGIEWAVQKYGAAPQGVAGTSPTVTV